MDFNARFINDVLEWKEIYALPFRVALDTKLREFQYKLLNRCLVTNILLYKINVVQSQACSLCGEIDESLEHFFVSCHYSKNFWAEVIKWLENLDIKIKQLSDKDVFGILKCEDELFVNHILLVAKQYLYSCRQSKSLLSIKVLSSKITLIYQIGRRERAGVDSHPSSPTPLAGRRRGRAGVDSHPPSPTPLAGKRRGRAGVDSHPPSPTPLAGKRRGRAGVDSHPPSPTPLAGRRRGRAGVDSHPPSPTPLAERRRGRAGVDSHPPSLTPLAGRRRGRAGDFSHPPPRIIYSNILVHICFEKFWCLVKL